MVSVRASGVLYEMNGNNELVWVEPQASEEYMFETRLRCLQRARFEIATLEAAGTPTVT